VAGESRTEEFIPGHLLHRFWGGEFCNIGGGDSPGACLQPLHPVVAVSDNTFTEVHGQKVWIHRPLSCHRFGASAGNTTRSSCFSPPTGTLRCMSASFGTVATTDYHTAGEPFRIVSEAVPVLSGSTVAERR